MSIRRQWLVSIGAFAALGATAGISAGVAFLLGFAERASQEWLTTAARNGVTEHTRQLGQRLEDEAGELARILGAGPTPSRRELEAAWDGSDTPDQLWLLCHPDGAIESSLGACEAAPPRLGEGSRYALCGDVPVMVGAAPGLVRGGARLWVGRSIGPWFVEALERVTAAHVLLVTPAGVAWSTAPGSSGEPLVPALPDGVLPQIQALDAPSFLRLELLFPRPYGGYRLGGRTIAEGPADLDVYAMAGPLDPADSALPLHLVLFVPTRVMNEGAHVVGTMLAIIAVVIVALLLLIGWRLVVSFTRPLARLAEATSRVARGDLGAQVPIEGRGEVADLARSFNVMLDRLAESQERVLQSEKMAAIGQLAGGIAHEVNNPIGVILGFAQGMERRLADGDPLRLPVGSIVREAQRCKALVQELLTFSRQAPRAAAPVEPRAVVTGAVAAIEARAREAGVALRAVVPDRLPCLSGSQTQLEQVLVNLGTNAVDATRPGGAVTLEATADGGEVVLAVTDTGSGISADVRARMFEPFFTTKEPGRGTGLGLALVFEMVKQHRGTVTCESALGSGTTMRVRLPACEGTPVGARGATG